MKRPIVITAFVIAVLGALAIRVVIEGRGAIADGDAALAAGRPLDAIRAYEGAARWYLPFAPHVDAAYGKLRALAAEKCGAWQSGEMGREAAPFTPTGAETIIVKPQQKQQIVLLAWPSVSVQDDGLYAAYLAMMVLGDGTGSRLFWNIYQKGLAETAVASLSPMDGTGMSVAFISTTPEHAPGVLELLRAELRSLQTDGVHEDELRRAKDKLVSRTVLDGDSAFSRMQDLAYTWAAKAEVRTIQDEIAEIEAVTLADVRRVLDRFPCTEHHVLTTYGPLDGAAFGVSASA